MTHICVSKLTIIGSANGLSPGRRQAIIWTNAGILSIGTLETNFSEILSKIRAFSFKKMHLKMSSAKWRPFCLGLNVLSFIAWRRYIQWNIAPQLSALTLNVRGPGYFRLTRSVPWLLMSGLLTSSGHQQPWYWLCKIGRFLSYLRKDLNYLRRINVEKWHTM